MYFMTWFGKCDLHCYRTRHWLLSQFGENQSSWGGHRVCVYYCSCPKVSLMGLSSTERGGDHHHDGTVTGRRTCYPKLISNTSLLIQQFYPCLFRTRFSFDTCTLLLDAVQKAVCKDGPVWYSVWSDVIPDLRSEQSKEHDAEVPSLQTLPHSS